MSKRHRRGRRHQPFLMLPHWIFDSIAYRELSANDRAVLHELVRRYNGTNNGSIGLGNRMAGDLCNFKKDTARRSFDRLRELGFIVLSKPSNFNTKTRHACEWALTWERNDATGEIATRDFLRWAPQNSEHGRTRAPHRRTDNPVTTTEGAKEATTGASARLPD